MTFKKSLLVIAVATALLSACSEEKVSSLENEQSAIPVKVTGVEATTASEQANALFDTLFKEGVNRDPVRQTYLGIKTDYDKWNDLSESNAANE